MAEIGQGLSIGSRSGQRLRTEILETASVDLIRAGLRDDVDNAARRAAEFGVGATGHDLKLLDGLQRDIDGCALASHLFAEEAVVVIAPVEADVIEDAALAVEVDFVAVRSLHDADAWSQSQQVLELAP